jgi:Raf kinase inhibitor-like YbhB/YbcL family protein
MKYYFAFLTILIVSAISLYVYYVNSPYFKGEKRTLFGKVESVTLKSSAFENKGLIPLKYTCDGENISPPLIFNAVPYGTRSLVLIMEDIDSSPKNFTHWLMFNIDAYSTGIEENFVSDSVAIGKNDLGNTNYSGPCPLTGTHRYIFKLFAINTILVLERGATKDQVLSQIQGHIIDEAEIQGIYKKQ